MVLRFKFKWTLAIGFLIAANLLPVAGVLLFEWDVSTILLLYWLETVVIGAVNIPKMWMCTGGSGSKLYLSAFFAAHFGGFSWGHLAFLKQSFDLEPVIPAILAGGALAATALSFLVSHIFSMFYNFIGKREYEGRDAGEQMFFPYGRIVVMHVVIIFGGF